MISCVGVIERIGRGQGKGAIVLRGTLGLGRKYNFRRTNRFPSLVFIAMVSGRFKLGMGRKAHAHPKGPHTPWTREKAPISKVESLPISCIHRNDQGRGRGNEEKGGGGERRIYSYQYVSISLLVLGEITTFERRITSHPFHSGNVHAPC